jgi:phosphatidylglycerophosphate synthase
MLLYQNPSLDDQFSTGLYVLTIIGLYCRTTLDAVDGKHARLHGYSTPVGDLIDHGLDVLNSQFIIMLFTHCLGLKSMFWSTVIIAVGWCIVNIGFFGAYCTGILVTSNGKVGSSELELFCIILMAFACINGCDYFDCELREVGLFKRIFGALSIDIANPQGALQETLTKFH